MAPILMDPYRVAALQQQQQQNQLLLAAAQNPLLLQLMTQNMAGPALMNQHYSSLAAFGGRVPGRRPDPPTGGGAPSTDAPSTGAPPPNLALATLGMGNRLIAESMQLGAIAAASLVPARGIPPAYPAPPARSISASAAPATAATATARAPAAMLLPRPSSPEAPPRKKHRYHCDRNKLLSVPSDKESVNLYQGMSSLIKDATYFASVAAK